ncbi:MAG: hypothetical protein Q7S55_03355 [Nanoarchaeota archaeon]|nr:hypothetical protein [Nanoarchaeota archaeon]
MRITYTATEIKGRWPEHPRIAKETLKAVIEEAIIPLGIAKSYTMINSSEFPYPHEKPNPYNMKEFFKTDNIAKIVGEIELLYRSLSEKRNTDDVCESLTEIRDKKRNNLAGWYSNAHHGQGIWIARLVDPQNQAIALWERETNVEQALEYRDMPHHTIQL